MQKESSNKRILRNTVYLYFRMILSMAVSLYTSRVVLDVLGVSDFGIYNVIGGVVVLISIINNSMSAATQRFITFELG
ncbi:lipopolysaccharide biosynthesis protein, partial [Bacteroides thetaiotaomicron]|nr:lipopolysaccharide biosynthesis protein [Bacteroides thetaiotaomicron]